MENVQTETKVKKSNKKLMVILIIAAVVALIATAVLLALFNPTVKTLHKIALCFSMTLSEFLDFPELNDYSFDD